MSKKEIHVNTKDTLRFPNIYKGERDAEISISYEETIGNGRPVEEIRAEIIRHVDLAMNKLTAWRQMYAKEEPPQPNY